MKPAAITAMGHRGVRPGPPGAGTPRRGLSDAPRPTRSGAPGVIAAAGKPNRAVEHSSYDLARSRL